MSESISNFYPVLNKTYLFHPATRSSAVTRPSRGLTVIASNYLNESLLDACEFSMTVDHFAKSGVAKWQCYLAVSNLLADFVWKPFLYIKILFNQRKAVKTLVVLLKCGQLLEFCLILLLAALDLFPYLAAEFACWQSLVLVNVYLPAN